MVVSVALGWTGNPGQVTCKVARYYRLPYNSWAGSRLMDRLMEGCPVPPLTPNRPIGGRLIVGVFCLLL